jgi:hemolysin activation/secretion protein
MKKIILSTVAISYIAMAQQPNISNIQNQIKQPKIEKKSVELPKVDTQLKAPLKSFDKKTKYIKSYNIEGNNHIPTSELMDIAKEYEDKRLTFDAVHELTTKITKYYRSKGYFVARAYIPKQNMQNSVLTISIIEGEYGKFHLNNDSLVNTNVVQAMLDDVKKYNIVSTTTLERAMLIINDSAGVQVSSAEVMPGAKVGTSDFRIATKPTTRYDGYAMVDNYGSKATGKHRVNGGININSPLGRGDKLTLSTLLTKNKGLTNGRIGYEIPIMPNGLKLNTSISHTTYNLGGEYASLDAVGKSTSVDMGLVYPYMRTTNENINLYTTLAYKKLQDEIRSTNTKTDKKLTSLKIGANYDNIFENSNIYFDIYITGGELSFDDETSKAIDKAGANSDGVYYKANIDINYNIALLQNITLQNSLKLQQTLKSKNLDGSEDFTVSGSNGVKAYLDSELSGERGYLFGTEAFYTLPMGYGRVGLFYDIGGAYQADDSNINTTNYTLQDTGLGYYGNYKSLSYQLQFAHSLGGYEASNSDNERVLFSTTYIF